MHTEIRIDNFGPGDARRSAFEALRDRCCPGAGPEPVAPDAGCLLASHGREPMARCSVQIAADLYGAPGPSGIVGHYEASDAGAGVALLHHVQRMLAAAGVARVIGPMNGSTWYRYRLALPTESGDSSFEPPVFLTEPRNAFDYPEHFHAAGFSLAARYVSRIVEDPVERERSEALARRLRAHGIGVRAFEPARFDQELAEVHTLSCAAFARSPYFAPIQLSEFRALYDRLRPLIDPELVLLAHDEGGRLLGFGFAFPDLLSAVGGRPTRVVLKTVATVPEARRLGLGAHLSDCIHLRARERGYRAVIHALMHTANDSIKASARHRSALFRRYALYQWIP